MAGLGAPAGTGMTLASYSTILNQFYPIQRRTPSWYLQMLALLLT